MKIIINGACGRMGQAVRTLCEADFHAAQAVALVDMNSVTAPTRRCGNLTGKQIASSTFLLRVPPKRFAAMHKKKNYPL